MGTHRKSGFTIVELLVVITIITILMSLLLPAINGALKQAEKTQCLSNLRQIALAMITYKTEWGCYPPARWYEYRPTGQPYGMFIANVKGVGAVSRPLPRWQFILKEELNLPPQNPFDSDVRYPPPNSNWMMLANTAMSAESRIFKCPSLSSVNLDLDMCHYGYNYQYLGNTRHCWWQGGAVAGGSFYGQQTVPATGARIPYANFPVTSGAIKAAHMTIAFADSAGDRQTGHGRCAYLIDPPLSRERPGSINRSSLDLYAAYMGPAGQTLRTNTPDWDGDGLLDYEMTTDLIYGQNYNTSGFCPIDFRHSNKASVAFCDGHAESMSLQDVGYKYNPLLDLDGDGTPDGGIEPNATGDIEIGNKFWNGTGFDPYK